MVEVVPGGVSCRHEERGQGGRSSRDTPDLWRSVLQHVVYLSGSACVAGGEVLLHDGGGWGGGGGGGGGCTGAVSGSGCLAGGGVLLHDRVVVVVVVVRVLSLGQGVWQVEGYCSMMGWWWW